jgi:hypothetical protein
MRDRINAALREAMLAKDRLRTNTLRLMLAAIRDRDIARRADESGAEIDDAEIMQLLARMVKQREESAAAYETGGRMELAEAERAEIGVIQEFLPRPLSEQEVDAAVDRAIADAGATSIRDMGKVMGLLKSRHAGQMNFAEAGVRVKDRLA